MISINFNFNVHFILFIYVSAQQDMDDDEELILFFRSVITFVLRKYSGDTRTISVSNESE